MKKLGESRRFFFNDEMKDWNGWWLGENILDKKMEISKDLTSFKKSKSGTICFTKCIVSIKINCTLVFHPWLHLKRRLSAKLNRVFKLFSFAKTIKQQSYACGCCLWELNNERTHPHLPNGYFRFESISLTKQKQKISVIFVRICFRAIKSVMPGTCLFNTNPCKVKKVFCVNLPLIFYAWMNTHISKIRNTLTHTHKNTNTQTHTEEE